MNNKIVIVIIGAALIIAGVWFFGGVWVDNAELVTEENSNFAAGTQLAGTPQAEVDFSGNPLIGGDAIANPKIEGEFGISVIYSAEYGFSPESFTVQRGDTVRLNIRSAQGNIALDIPDYDITLEKITDTDGDQTVEFVAAEVGEFKFSNALGAAEGTIVVE